MPAGYDAEAAHKSEAGSRKQTLGARAAHLQSAANLKLNAQVLRTTHGTATVSVGTSRDVRSHAKAGGKGGREQRRARKSIYLWRAGSSASPSRQCLRASHTKRRDTVGHSGETRRKNRPGSGGASGAKARRNEQMRMTTKLECRFSYTFF